MHRGILAKSRYTFVSLLTLSVLLDLAALISEMGAEEEKRQAFLEDVNDSCEFGSESPAENSTNSSTSWSSSELADDASSAGSCSSQSSSASNNGPLFGLSELMTHLPIKRGLSKYYEGKSESFACLADVESMEDLAKKENPQRKKFKSFGSYGGLDGHRWAQRAKAKIQKKGQQEDQKGSSAMPTDLLFQKRHEYSCCFQHQS